MNTFTAHVEPQGAGLKSAHVVLLFVGLYFALAIWEAGRYANWLPPAIGSGLEFGGVFLAGALIWLLAGHYGRRRFSPQGLLRGCIWGIGGAFLIFLLDPILLWSGVEPSWHMFVRAILLGVPSGCAVILLVLGSQMLKPSPGADGRP